jgi:hypothetical protein
VDRRALLLAGTFGALGVVSGCRATPTETTSTPAPADHVAPPEPSSSRAAAPPSTVEPSPESARAEEAEEAEVVEEVETATEADPEPVTETPRVEVICRDALGLVAATAGGRQHRVDRLTLHHTAVELGDNRLAPERLRGHQRFHHQQGWPDIAYHYAVDLRGNVYELRAPGLAGDTFTDYDPTGHFLVVCEGNFDHEQPTDTMLHGVAEILAHAADAYGAPLASLTGHRDHVSGITCPGDNLHPRLGELRAAAETLRAEGPRELSSLCGEEGRQRITQVEAGAA